MWQLLILGCRKGICIDGGLVSGRLDGSWWRTGIVSSTQSTPCDKIPQPRFTVRLYRKG